MPLDVERIRSVRPQNGVHYFASIGSTMTEAQRLATAGAPHGTVILADQQTAGIGRLGREWLSEAEAGIYCSIVLRLPLEPAAIPIASLLAGLATAEAIEKTTQLACDLRWPNDVLIKERKTAGILTQLFDSCVIAGIGINVNQTHFPDGLRTPATSLRLESGGSPQSREDLIINLLGAIDEFARLLVSSGPGAILRAFSAASTYVLDRRVVVEENGCKGTTNGLDSNGFLLLRTEEGRVQRIASGGIRPA
ncbi:MAG: biotin--[acetyl-CoA-carboxylase] ligase [Acidobacteriaceae bacterium]|nr:biotin--[acetyl-CoA-carboxylase] ligase [Acidobacteriaceae bacterium]MBV8569176.1 biotin--[acetyl-CoA-carboxylase] ligase [Acidobacteriaceae bacterium]